MGSRTLWPFYLHGKLPGYHSTRLWAPSGGLGVVGEIKIPCRASRQVGRGWTVRGSNPGKGEIFGTRSNQL